MKEILKSIEEIEEMELPPNQIKNLRRLKYVVQKLDRLPPNDELATLPLIHSMKFFCEILKDLRGYV